MSTGAFIKWGLVVAVSVSAIYGLLYWVSSGVNLLSRSMGAANAVSNSLEPYELVFRSAIKENSQISAGERPYEWKLELPRAYVESEFGSRSAVSGNYPMNNQEDAHYGLFISALFNFTTQETRPAVNSKNVGPDEAYLGFSISNGMAMLEILNGENCLRADDLWQKVELNGGGKAPAAKECSTRDAKCQIYTHYHGWSVKLFVPRKSITYQVPQKACEVAKLFLDKHTKQIDNLN
jgi:hypothetical protein